MIGEVRIVWHLSFRSNSCECEEWHLKNKQRVLNLFTSLNF